MREENQAPRLVFFSEWSRMYPCTVGSMKEEKLNNKKSAEALIF
jgi:hypothetical protein